MNYPTTSFTGGVNAWCRWLRRWAGLLWVAMLAAISLQAQDSELFPPKPYPAVYVHDYSGWLSEQEKAFLENKLRHYADTTSTQVVVMIRPDIGDYDRASYAFELGNRWGIGRKDKNNGVVVLIVSEPPQRGAFIATGYGVEGALPDITAGQIVRYLMIPRFKEGRYFEGINAGLDGIMAALSGEFQADQLEEAIHIPLWVIILFLVLIFLFIRFMIKHGTMYTGTGPIHRGPVRTYRGGRYWGGGWSGGSFGGGGWGGGGGGFGGGSFGGGGAGGSW
ncbi:MAG: TPM domain-containing protein [Saprospiraceae bacterium]|nr:TPM domain-containing protein [Saprospiraceae bacterium]MDW8229733.1 TPM domain-containing protein [Saprospiraceae bacterium]